MPDKDEKARRKQLLHSQRDEERRSFREGLPVPAAMMKALFTYVDKHLSSSECDDTLRHASEFIRVNDLPKETVVAWLEDKGGYCDCEVFNAEEALEDAVPGLSKEPWAWTKRISFCAATLSARLITAAATANFTLMSPPKCNLQNS